MPLPPVLACYITILVPCYTSEADCVVKRANLRFCVGLTSGLTGILPNCVQQQHILSLVEGLCH